MKFCINVSPYGNFIIRTVGRYIQLYLVMQITKEQILYCFAKRTYRLQQLWCIIFPPPITAYFPSIPLDSYWVSVCLATLPDIPSLICDFCLSDQRFVIDLLQISPYDGLSLVVCFPLSGTLCAFADQITPILSEPENGGQSFVPISDFSLSIPALFYTSIIFIAPLLHILAHKPHPSHCAFVFINFCATEQKHCLRHFPQLVQYSG